MNVLGIVVRMANKPRALRHTRIAPTGRWLLSRRSAWVPHATFSGRRIVALGNVQARVAVPVEVRIATSVIPLTAAVALAVLFTRFVIPLLRMSERCDLRSQCSQQERPHHE